MIDLLVAGGGPAGLATALHAARAGLSVTVLDPRAAPTGEYTHEPDGRPIDKACGEGLMPGAVGALRDLGVRLDGGHELRGIRYLDGRRTATADFAAGPGLGLRRTSLHAAMRAAVDRAGVRVLACSAGDLRQDATSVTAGGVRARWLAAADGLHSPIRRQLGLGVPDRRPARYGLRAHFPMAPWGDYVEVHWSRDSEAYVTPVGPDLVGIAVLSARRATYGQHLAAFPALADRVLDVAPTTAVRGAGPLRQRVSARVAGRVLLVGDAAGYVDALTGEGIAMACAEAAALVRCVSGDTPAAYEQAWRDVTRSYRVVTEGLLWARNRPLLAPLVVPAAAALPRVFAAAVQQLAGAHPTARSAAPPGLPSAEPVGESSS